MAIHEDIEIQRLSANMNEMREQGHQIFLQQYLNDYHPGYASDEPELRLERYYEDMNIDYWTATVSQVIELVNRDPAYGYLFLEMILPALYEAMYDNVDYRQLLAFSVRDNRTVATQPYVTSEMTTVTREKGKGLAPGETPNRQKMSIGAKFTSPDDFGDIFEVDYSTVADVRIPVLNIFFRQYVKAVNVKKLVRILKTLISGDDATDVKTKTKVENGASTIGVKSTSNGLAYYDIKRVGIRFIRLSRQATSIVGPEDLINDISEMDEFKTPRDGKPISVFKISGVDPVPRNGIICDISDLTGKIIVVDKAAAIAEYVRQGLMIEQEKLISKRVIVVAFNERLHYQNLLRQGKVIVDPTKEFSSNGFPAYMTPIT